VIGCDASISAIVLRIAGAVYRSFEGVLRRWTPRLSAPRAMVTAAARDVAWQDVNQRGGKGLTVRADPMIDNRVPPISTRPIQRCSNSNSSRPRSKTAGSPAK